MLTEINVLVDGPLEKQAGSTGNEHNKWQERVEAANKTIWRISMGRMNETVSTVTLYRKDLMK